MEYDQDVSSNINSNIVSYIPELITSCAQAIRNIIKFNEEVKIAPADSILVSRLLQFTSRYAIDHNGERTLFGPSKFIGYDNIDCKKYENISTKHLHGSNTEARLKKWSILVKVKDDNILGNTPIVNLPIYIDLKKFLNQFGKLPRKNARIYKFKT